MLSFGKWIRIREMQKSSVFYYTFIPESINLFCDHIHSLRPLKNSCFVISTEGRNLVSH
jgi:hypothetical protein